MFVFIGLRVFISYQLINSLNYCRLVSRKVDVLDEKGRDGVIWSNNYSIKLIFIKALLPELPALRIFLLAPVPEADNEEVEDEVDPGNNKNQFTT